MVNNPMTGECVGMHKYFKKIMVSIIAVVLISGTLYLQYGRELDVKGSYYSGDTLSFNVILNRLWYKSSDQESIKHDVLKKYSENNFHSVLFSTDLMHPKQIIVSIYLNSKGMQNEPLFTFSIDCE